MRFTLKMINQKVISELSSICGKGYILSSLKNEKKIYYFFKTSIDLPVANGV